MHVTLDSRLVKPGDYFVPVVGDTTDGHKFVDAAIKNGAVGVIEVDELYRIATEKLKKINPKIIAITGSVGKSTTKQFILKLLSTKYRTCDGYLNTKLGLATTIVNDMKDDCEIFVAECGMDRKGELLETGEFLNPHIVVLTNISESHMEKLGSIDEIMEAKAELVRSIRSDGIGYFNATNDYVVKVAHKYPTSKNIFYGDVFSKIIEENTNDLPVHFKENIEVAYQISKYFEIKDEILIPVMQKISSPKGRLNKLKGINGCVIFDDTYNASPESTISAIKFINDYANKNKMKRKIVVLGGMLELGSFEDEGHTKVGDCIAEFNIDVVVLAGNLSKKYLKSEKLTKSNIRIIECEDSNLAGQNLVDELSLNANDIVLVKGSQGIRMEKAVEKILRNPEQASEVLVRQDARWK